MTSEQQNPLAVDKISSLILRFSVPSIIAMLVSAVYNIADQLFIGNAVGTLGNAATNIAFPLAMMCTGLGLLFGIGGAASFNLHMGCRQKRKSSLFCRKRHHNASYRWHPSFCHNRIIFKSSAGRIWFPCRCSPLARQYVRVTAIGFLFNSYDRKRTLNPCQTAAQRWRCL